MVGNSSPVRAPSLPQSRSHPPKKTMVKRTRLNSAACPVARALDVIGDWWSLLIVRDAFDGMRRFGEFQSNLGLAKNVLAARLRTLVAHDIFAMVPAADGSAYQEYVLTPKGRDLFNVIVGLRQWGEAHSFAAGERYSRLVDRIEHFPIQALGVRAKDGRLLGPDDTVVMRPPAQQSERSQPPKPKLRSKKSSPKHSV